MIKKFMEKDLKKEIVAKNFVYRVTWSKCEEETEDGPFISATGERLFTCIKKAGKFQDEIQTAIDLLCLGEEYDSLIEKIELDNPESYWEDCVDERPYDDEEEA